jgi:RNA polymerase sigma-70 factor (ECF subfamily)
MNLKTREKEYLDSEADERFAVEAIPHFPVLKRIAYRMVRNRHEAEDLVQETYAQAWQVFSRYQSGTNCRAWLCKIMFYKRLHRHRVNSRYLPLGANEFNLFRADDAREPLGSDFMSGKITCALESLPENFRRVVWLCDVEDFTYREVSENLRIPIGTVMSRLHRGRALLRRCLPECASDYTASSIEKTAKRKIMPVEIGRAAQVSI